MHTAASPFPNSAAAAPHDLRSVARAVKTHEVDPAVVADFKAKLAQLPPRIRPPLRNEKAPVGGRLRRADSNQKTAEAKGATTMNQTSTPTHPTTKAAELYPAASIAAARHEMAKENPRARRLAEIITPAVVAIWLDWLDEEKSIGWISQNNELMPMTYDSVVNYVNKHRTAAEEIRAAQNKKTAVPAPQTQPLPTAVAPQPAPKEVPNTAVLPPDPTPELEPATMTEATVAPEPEIEPLPTAIEPFAVERPDNLPSFFDREYRPPRPTPGAALATLAALIDNEQLRVKGSVKLNLEIEFGGE